MGQNAGFYALFTVAAVIALVIARSFDEDGNFTVGQTYYAEAPAVLVGDDGGTELSIRAGRGGSFVTEAVVDGATIPVLVDTGASFFTLRESDAAEAGIFVSPRDFTAEFSTANGAVFAAEAQVRSVELGPGRIDDVTVFVLPDDKLQVSLLGMNVLRRFGSVSFDRDALTISVN